MWVKTSHRCWCSVYYFGHYNERSLSDYSDKRRACGGTRSEVDCSCASGAALVSPRMIGRLKMKACASAMNSVFGSRSSSQMLRLEMYRAAKIQLGRSKVTQAARWRGFVDRSTSLPRGNPHDVGSKHGLADAWRTRNNHVALLPVGQQDATACRDRRNNTDGSSMCPNNRTLANSSRKSSSDNSARRSISQKSTISDTVSTVYPCLDDGDGCSDADRNAKASSASL